MCGSALKPCRHHVRSTEGFGGVWKLGRRGTGCTDIASYGWRAITKLLSFIASACSHYQSARYFAEAGELHDCAVPEPLQHWTWLGMCEVRSPQTKAYASGRSVVALSLVFGTALGALTSRHPVSSKW